jgi:hypothetical protein
MSIVTTGLGGPGGSVVTFGLTGGAIVEVAADLTESIVVALNANSTLITAFGGANWIWHTLAPPRAPVPYAVWREAGGSILGESGGDSWVSDNTYGVSVYAATRRQARTLCRQVVEAIETAVDAGEILLGEGAVMALHRDGGAFDQLDPDPGEDGADVWEHRITLRAFVDDQVIVS